MHMIPRGTLAASDLGRDVVGVACRAPSVHNTQPWRWHVAGDRIELYADRRRQLVVADPDGRDLLLSCGAALHHATVAAAARGFATQVQRFPNDSDPDHLASLWLTPAGITPTALEDARILQLRCTDRRRFTSWPVPDELLEQLAVEASDDPVVVLPVTEVATRLRTGLLVGRATASQQGDDALQAERRRWVGVSRADGIPRETLGQDHTALSDSQGAQLSLEAATPSRSAGEQLEGSDGLVVVVSHNDDRGSQLRAGEVLSRFWLGATAAGLSVVPLSQVVEVAETRSALEQLLGRVPQILMRVGWQQIGRHGLTRTPRHGLEDVLMP